MFAGAGRGVDDRGCHVHGSREGHDDPVHAGDLRGPEQAAEVLRVLEGVEDQNEWRFALLLRPFEHVRQVGVWIWTCLQGHALVVDFAARQLEMGKSRYLELATGGQFQDLRKAPGWAGVFRNLQAEELTPSRPEGLIHGVATIDQVLHAAILPFGAVGPVGSQARRFQAWEARYRSTWSSSTCHVTQAR